MPTAHLIAIFLAGGTGCVLRYATSEVALRLVGGAFPAGTLVVNIVGSALMGAAAAWLAAHVDIPATTRLLLTTGFLGGFTTFSTFSLDAVSLWQKGAFTVAAAYVVASIAVSIAALCLGAWLMRSVTA